MLIHMTLMPKRKMKKMTEYDEKRKERIMANKAGVKLDQ